MGPFILVVLGFFVGAYGTLIGAGGGFVLVPLLLLMYPGESPTTITSISLAVVFFNALSGSVAYGRLKRIDYRTGIMFALATIPGSIIGAYTVDLLSRGIFNVLFGILLILVSTSIFLRPQPVRNPEEQSLSGATRWGYVTRSLVDSNGMLHTYTFHQPLGIFLSSMVGFLSSLLGIGGGIIHVPMMIQLLNFPAHIATATSHFVLAIMAFSGSLIHISNGDLSTSWEQVFLLAVGVIFGAQLGARLSQRIHGVLILRLLAVALGIVGIRLITLAFV